MPMATQSKLLRVLQEKEVEPLGSNRVTKVDVRVIAASSVDLRQMVSMGEILTASRDTAESSRCLPNAALELLRRRRIWLPRWILLSLALVRLGSRRGARALFDWLTMKA